MTEVADSFLFLTFRRGVSGVMIRLSLQDVRIMPGEYGSCFFMVLKSCVRQLSPFQFQLL